MILEEYCVASFSFSVPWRGIEGLNNLSGRGGIAECCPGAAVSFPATTDPPGGLEDVHSLKDLVFLSSQTRPLVMISQFEPKTTHTTISPPFRAAKVPYGMAGGAASARLRRCDLGGLGKGLR